jgi:hypothetical protein
MDQHGQASPASENKAATPTLAEAHAFVEWRLGNIYQRVRDGLCGYVVTPDWRYGAGSPFCDAPALPGGSYCARHRRRCVLPRASRLARRRAARLARDAAEVLALVAAAAPRGLAR